MATKQSSWITTGSRLLASLFPSLNPQLSTLNFLPPLLAFALAPFALHGAEAAHVGHAAHGGDATVSKEQRAALAELGATAAFDARGRLWAAHKHEGHVVVSRSDDAGLSWAAPVRVNSALEPTDTGGDARPKIAIGPSGEIFVTWTKALSKPFTGEIRFARSVDDGRTFSAPVRVHRDSQEITHRFDALAVDASGRVFIAWIDKRDLIAATAAGTPYRGAALYFAVSDDRGATFRGDFKAADHTCECCRISLAPLPGGGATALWRHIFEPNIRDHAVTTLHADGRASPLRRATFDDWRLDACPHHGPSITPTPDGTVHAVWFTGGPSAGVYYGRLRDNDTAPDALRRVGGKLAANADLAADGPRLAIAWKEFDGERTRLRALRSDDAGRTWTEHKFFGVDGPSDQPRVLLRQGRFHVFWHTRADPLSVTPLP